jgi:urea carboxylase
MKSHAVNAEVAGTVWQVLVAVGDTVRAEQELIVLESMKMEIPSLAPHAGVVQQILVAPGDAVGEGQKLAVIAAG